MTSATDYFLVVLHGVLSGPWVAAPSVAANAGRTGGRDDGCRQDMHALATLPAGNAGVLLGFRDQFDVDAVIDRSNPVPVVGPDVALLRGVLKLRLAVQVRHDLDRDGAAFQQGRGREEICERNRLAFSQR